MESKLFKGYNRYVSLVWLSFATMTFVYIYSELPFGSALVFTASIIVPIYFCNSYLTNFLQPRAIKENNMGFFIVEFLVASFTMSLIFISICYLFYLLSENRFFVRSEIFVEMKDIKKGLFSTFPFFILVNLAFCGLRFYYEHTKLQRMHLEIELRMLQAQVNPHYMFNVLNHMHILMRKDVEKASFLLEKYSEILRYQLYNSKSSLVPLSKELKYIRDVISVERLRWGSDLQVETNWNIEQGSVFIEPLILIVFIENAFKHVSKSISDKGYVKILFRQKNDVFYMEIENSKWKKKDIHQKHVKGLGIGLQNTRDRLNLLYPESHMLNIIDDDDRFKVELTLTLRTEAYDTGKR